MDIHELKLLDFDDALDLVENRLVDIHTLIEKSQEEIPSEEAAKLITSKADAETQLARLRAIQTAEMSGERDNLLTEVSTLLDQIGQQISDLFPNRT